MIKLYLHKIKKAYKLLRSQFSASYSQKYYTNLAKQDLKNKSNDIIVHGKIIYTDKRQLVVGKGVNIGRNNFFGSEGGIYLEDGCTIGNNVVIKTLPNGINFDSLSAYDLKDIKPVIIPANTVVNDNTIIQANYFPDFKTSFNTDTGKHRFFIVSTGRSGTNAIAHMLNKHPDINCIHEAWYTHNRISTQLAHKLRTPNEIKEELFSLYRNCTTVKKNKHLYGECDLKNFNLIPFLAEIYPEAKFIWLTRRAGDFVASAFGRKWFDEFEYSHPQKVFSSDTGVDTDGIFDKWRIEYGRYRINGFMCGEFTKEEWMKMTCFERCCWYWSYANKIMENDLSRHAEGRFIQVKLEQLSSEQNSLYEFLNVSKENLEVKKTNAAFHAVVKSTQWSAFQQDVFAKWCSSGMKKWYNE